MAVAHKATGTLVTITNNATTLAPAIPAYTYASGDFHLLLVQKNATGFTFTVPAGWDQVVQNDHDPASGREHCIGAWVTPAVDGDQASTVTVTLSAANAFTVTAAKIVTLSGGNTSGLLDATAASVMENEPSDNVTFGAFDPTSTDITLVALAFMAEDATTLAASFGTPTFTNVSETETAAGTDLTIAVALAAGDGSAVSSGNTWASNSTLDNASTGVLFAIVNDGGGGGAEFQAAWAIGSNVVIQ